MGSNGTENRFKLLTNLTGTTLTETSSLFAKVSRKKPCFARHFCKPKHQGITGCQDYLQNL